MPCRADESVGVKDELAKRFGREIVPLTKERLGEMEQGELIWEELEGIEREARELGSWLRAPRVGGVAA